MCRLYITWYQYYWDTLIKWVWNNNFWKIVFICLVNRSKWSSISTTHIHAEKNINQLCIVLLYCFFYKLMIFNSKILMPIISVEIYGVSTNILIYTKNYI